MSEIKEGHLVETNSIQSDTELKKVTDTKNVDVSLKLFEDYEEQAGELTPELEKKLKRKIWLIIFPIVFSCNFLLFLDKNAISYGTLLGLFEDTRLDQGKYNNLQTIFYLGYMVGQIPSHYIFQRIRISHYVTGATFVWALVTFVQLAAHNFSGLAAIRFFLGLFESGITPCLEHTIAMWFTPTEQAIVAPLFWISCLAQGIPGGLISYGVQFIPNVRPWKVYWGIIGALSTILCVSCFFFYPDNPATFKYFTPTERIHVIKRIKKATNSSIEQKVFKRHQAIEALKDPITWLFSAFVFLSMLSNNITFQSAIIYKQLGFSNLNSTLVSVASAGWSTVASITGAILLVIFRAQSGHVGTFFTATALLGSIITVSLPLHNSYGILAGIFLTNCNGVTFIAAFSWAQSSAAGYTKRLVRTIMWSISYSIVNLIAPQIWSAKDKPRYYPAWIVIIVCSYTAAPLILQVIRFILSRRNKERYQYLKDIELGNAKDEKGIVTVKDEEGNSIEKEVDVSMLDLTDLREQKFIYPL
ncbi:High affinity cysteine transporter [Cyberlindnera fabianii]|uniref:High affinity cysteine transporter n=1 Tax=Cyberlindnera fabianii TaxID=36022 RepID=A0A1V2L379_CYBFA|nr:High affinity cysteine transporter [Cyberlindnera fabianii]